MDRETAGNGFDAVIPPDYIDQAAIDVQMPAGDRAVDFLARARYELDQERVRSHELAIMLQELESEVTSYKLDSLTGLLVRRAYVMESGSLREMVHEGTEPHGHNAAAVVLTDIRKLGKINKVGGHPAGDDVLENYGNWLPGIFKPEENLGITAGRLGGDEFGLTVAFNDKQYSVERVAEIISARINGWAVENTPYGVRIGDIAVSTTDKTMPDLFKEADPKAPKSRQQKLGRFLVNSYYGALRTIAGRRG